MLKLKEPEESESELEHRSSRVRSSVVGVGTSLVPRLLYAQEPGNEAKARLDGTTRKRSSLVHSQILSRSRGEKSIFLHGCEIQSGSGLGTTLEKNGLGTRPSKSRKEGLVNCAQVEVYTAEC